MQIAAKGIIIKELIIHRKIDDWKKHEDYEKNDFGFFVSRVRHCDEVKTKTEVPNYSVHIIQWIITE